MSYIHAFMTATVVRANGLEEHGWVDASWSKTTLWAARNDAGTLLSTPEHDEYLMEYISDLVYGYRDNGDGTFYAEDPEVDIETGDSWSYAIHFISKNYQTNGWGETPFVPVFPEMLTESAEDVKVFHEL